MMTRNELYSCLTDLEGQVIQRSGDGKGADRLAVYKDIGRIRGIVAREMSCSGPLAYETFQMIPETIRNALIFYDIIETEYYLRYNGPMFTGYAK